jgi:hypothetical protein
MTDREKLEVCVDYLLRIATASPRPKRNGDYYLHDVQAPRFLARGALRLLLKQKRRANPLDATPGKAITLTLLGKEQG